MNKAELAEMKNLRRTAEAKIPSYEKSIKELKCQITEWEKSTNKNNPEVVITMRDAMVELFQKFPKAKFTISGDFGYHNSYTLRTTDVCPL